MNPEASLRHKCSPGISHKAFNTFKIKTLAYFSTLYVYRVYDKPGAVYYL